MSSVAAAVAFFIGNDLACATTGGGRMRIDRRLFLAYVGGTVLTAFALDDSSNAEAIAISVPGGTLNVRNVPNS